MKRTQIWWFGAVRLFLFILCSTSTSSDRLTSLVNEISSTIVNKSHAHYCPFIAIGTAIERISKLGSKNSDVLVHTPCFALDSFGNKWSNYIEARICANITGLHYAGVSMQWGKINNDDFLAIVPSNVYNPKKTSVPPGNLKSACPCHTMCHEQANGLMHRHPEMVRDLFLPSIERHLAKIQPVRVGTAWKKTIRTNSSSGLSLSSGWPAVPDVAVHYRCGDNTVGPYGFLPYTAVRNRIKSTMASPGTIYVLAEPAGRKTKLRQMSRCNVILEELHGFLATHFPTTTVLTLRGLSLYDDLVRLTMAKVTICSVSTFCLFPAISASHEVFFPVTTLVAESTNPVYGPHFHWMNKAEERIVPGPKALQMELRSLVQFLSSKRS